MAISRFQSRFKTRPDLMDNITPNNVVQMNASVPAGEWKPASWLPVVWQNDRSKDYFVISSGKVVSFDASGRIVPSGLIRLAEAIGAGDAFLTYTSEDEAARVVGVEGDFVEAGDSLTLQEFCAAVIKRGWMPGEAAPANDADCRDFVRKFISAPVGVAAYDVYVWAGDDPANLHFTNYQKQHLIQFFSDVQMRVAHVCDTNATLVTLGNGDEAAVEDIVDANTLSRFSGLPNKDDIVVLDLGLGKLASITSRTPLSFGAGDFVGRLRKDPALLSKDGDYFLDADAGLLLFHKSGGGGAPSDINARLLQDTDTISVFDYSAGASSDERMMHLVGDARPGDFVTFDAHSNFKVRSLNNDIAVGAAEADIEATLALLHREEEYTVGRVYELQKEPRGLLERVKTGWSGDEFDASSKMPGSATEGFSDLITLSENKIADEIAIINVKMK